MNLRVIEEPALLFGKNEHICPRAGIALYEVYDTRFDIRQDKLVVGAVGTRETLEKLEIWLDRCSKPIPAKLDSRQPNLFPAFCGFNLEGGFRAKMVIGERIVRSIDKSDIRALLRVSDRNQLIEEAVELYYQQIKFLAQNRSVDVIVCTLPTDVYKAVGPQEKKSVSIEETVEEEKPDDIEETNFRRALKGRAMHLGKPLQLIIEQSLEAEPKGRQDDATRAWNFCTALYYKGSQTIPWKLPTNPSHRSTCFVGIGFYRSRDRKVLHTSLAQIFDELGNNVILRGTPVEIDKDDRRPHLKNEQAYELLDRALAEYEIALRTAPARVVIHKSSNFSEAELDGFRSAMREHRVGAVDFVTILDSEIRLFRHADYPPLRGTQIELDKQRNILYTRGSVPYYETYPGDYIPQPIDVRLVESDESANVICNEIMALSKMNWNNTQFDGKYPITILCARKVGNIMKYIPPEEHPQISYSFYM